MLAQLRMSHKDAATAGGSPLPRASLRCRCRNQWSRRVSEQLSVVKARPPRGERPSAMASAARMVPPCATAMISEPRWASFMREIAAPTRTTTSTKLSPFGARSSACAYQNKPGSCLRSLRKLSRSSPCQCPRFCSAKSVSWRSACGFSKSPAAKMAAAVCCVRVSWLVTQIARRGKIVASRANRAASLQSQGKSRCP